MKRDRPGDSPWPGRGWAAPRGDGAGAGALPVGRVTRRSPSSHVSHRVSLGMKIALGLILCLRPQLTSYLRLRQQREIGTF